MSHSSSGMLLVSIREKLCALLRGNFSFSFFFSASSCCRCNKLCSNLCIDCSRLTSMGGVACNRRSFSLLSSKTASPSSGKLLSLEEIGGLMLIIGLLFPAPSRVSGEDSPPSSSELIVVSSASSLSALSRVFGIGSALSGDDGREYTVAPAIPAASEKELSSAVDSGGYMVRGVLAALAASICFFALFVSTFCLCVYSGCNVCV